MTNRAFEELEKRCKRLNNRIYLKSFFSFVFLLLFLFFGYSYFFYSKDKTLHVNIEETVKIQTEKNETKKSVLKEVTEEKLTEKVFKPDDKKSNIIGYDTIILKSNIVLPNRKTTEKKSLKEEKTTVAKREKESSERKKLHIKVKSMSADEAYIKSNSSTEGYDKSLNLARYYFKHKKFNKAIFYSKKASQDSPDKEEPWLIYIKSKMGLGQNKEALKTLNTFLSYFNSKEGERLLKELKDKR